MNDKYIFSGTATIWANIYTRIRHFMNTKRRNYIYQDWYI